MQNSSIKAHYDRKESKCMTSIVSRNQLLSSCSTSSDIGLHESRDSSEDEPTLTMAFNVDDSEDNIL
ncbi:unnamed protein product [Oppiella nova]|uniref:Uncharacterized protein n=1 Tax=Oppiella nova TaxID=334625 RepID=A0A7R9MJ64_9ACAR|nr:unnamed protein product [Oppiella nova]CAG2178363.1 unnamed protein product [Oppiella nova]